MKLLCIFTTLLGHRTMVGKLQRALESLPGIDPAYVLIGNEDYVKYPAPWWARATHPWHAQFVARQKVKEAQPADFDAVFFNAWELAVCFKDMARKTPAAAILDAVPSTFDIQLRQRGQGGWKRRLSNQVHDRAFRRAAREIDVFLPMGSDCTDALQRHYGVPRKRCLPVTFPPQDLEASRHDARIYAPPLRLLFVGQEFIRKGGDFLLRLYSERLAGNCTLTIVSTDPALEGRPLPPGVEKLSSLSLDELHQVYRNSHLFLFPTQQDFMPQVLAEALTFGLPCMATDVGAIRDVIHDNETGFLMPKDAPMDAWASRIDRLAANPAELARLAVTARLFAEDKFDSAHFRTALERALGSMVLEGQAKKRAAPV
jgi:glycosyltransferase involved in cell wall biosynthesis